MKSYTKAKEINLQMLLLLTPIRKARQRNNSFH